jgi:hypothetical protein
VFLELGRVSNLPTVWSNVLAGMVLSGGWLAPGALLAVLAGASAIYVGGMFLNDAFDAEIDARERPERPIPSGRIARRAVFAIGFAQLAGGVLLFAAVSLAGGARRPRARRDGRALRRLAQGERAQPARHGPLPGAGLCSSPASPPPPHPRPASTGGRARSSPT